MEASRQQVQLELTYTAATVRAAAWAFVRRSKRKALGFGVAILIVAAAPLSLTLQYRWLGGMWFGVAMTLLVGVVQSYSIRSRPGLRRVRQRAVQKAKATLLLTEFELSIRTELSSSTIPWSTFLAVWRFPDIWLLLISPEQYIGLPVIDLSEEAQAFILARLSDAGAMMR